MQEVKKYILKQLSQGLIDQAEAVALLKELRGASCEEVGNVAIIGMSCRLPMANSVEEYWDNLLNGRCCFVAKPADKMLGEEAYKNPYYQECIGIKIPEDSDKLESSIGAFIPDSDKFDADFFNISPREATYIDPSQRVFLELAWAAVEDAGYSVGTINDTKTGVFVGKDYSNSLNYKMITAPDAMKTTGTWEGLLASRLSYAFNLSGPTMVIDTACSSGLVAVHEACNAIRNGECDMALAGGISIGAGGASTTNNDEDEQIEKDTTNSGTLGAVTSDDNRVRTFDKKCSGSVFGEGIVVFMLKSYENAVKDGDHIYAVIKGSAINNDGASNGITAPNPLAQAEVISEAWKRAQVSPDTIDYIEAHGTGTLLGDPIEILGITKAFEKRTNKKQFCGIGSVKTNIGHLVAASGCASLLKVTLALQNNIIPPSINFEEPNQNIDFLNSPVYVVDKSTPWSKKDRNRRAGINAFGFSGTNCHMIVEEVPERTNETSTVRESNIITFSGKTETALKTLIKKYCEFLKMDRKLNFDDICYTANVGRGHYSCRLAVIAKNTEDLKNKLNRLVENDFEGNGLSNVYIGKHRIVSEKYLHRAEGEITEREARELTIEADSLISDLAAQDQYDYGKLDRLAYLYAKGAGVQWKNIYEGEKHNKVSLPTYCFERISYWAEPKVSQIDPDANIGANASFHPVVDKVLVSSYDETIFLAKFELSKHWFVKEHKIMGSNIVPGTAYIEVVKAACKKYFDTDKIEIKSLTFIQPLVVGEEPVATHIIFKKTNAGIEFVVATKPDETGNKWMLHAEGSVQELTQKPVSEYNVAEYAKDGEEIVINIPENETDELVYMGPRWHCIKHIYRNGDVLQSEVELNDKFDKDLENYEYHPSLADAALNVPLQVYIENAMYLPLAYKGLKIYGNLPKHFFSRLEKLSGGNGSETISFKVELADEKGNIIVEIDEYTTKKVGKFNSYVANTYYGIGWKKVDNNDSVKEEIKINGNVMIFSDGRKLATELSQKLTNADRIIFVNISDKCEKIGDDRYSVDGTENGYSWLFDQLDTKQLEHVFHFAGIGTLSKDADIATYQEESKFTLYSLFLFPKVLLRRITGKTAFYLFGENAHMVTGEEGMIKPMSNAFLSIVKTLTAEYINCTFRAFDITEKETTDQIYAAVTDGDNHLITALRGDDRYVEVLEETNVQNVPQNELKICKDGVYLITGGTGGLGLEISKYIAELGAGNICLLARHAIPERSKWEDILSKKRGRKVINCINTILDLEKLGLNVIIKQTDVSDFDEMKETFEELTEKFGRINGVIHCAGVAGDGFLYNKSKEAFNEVIEPKIKGSLVIYELLKQNTPDFIVMFSSMQTIFGGSGQGDYTAANSFMDAFAFYLQEKGINAKTINWPGWLETGMAVDYGVSDTMTLFKSLTTKKALIGFNFIMHHDISNVIPGEINVEFLYKAGQVLPFEISHQLKKTVARFAAKNSENEAKNKGRRFDPNELVIHGKQNNEYTDIERTVAFTYAAVLDINEIDVFENFNSMGGDSIIAAEVLKLLNQQYNDSLNISDMFTYPCVVEMAEHISEIVSM